MTLFHLIYYFCLFLIPFLLYTVFKKNDDKKGWFYIPKYYLALKTVKSHLRGLKEKTNPLDHVHEYKVDYPSDEHTNSQQIFGIDKRNNSISLNYTIRSDKYAEISLCLRVNGQLYTFPDEPNVRLLSILDEKQWKSKDFSIEITEPFKYLRTTFNGILKNVASGKLEHIQFNFVWTSAASPKHFPLDVNPYMLVESIVSEKWRDGDWSTMLTDLSESFEQFGALRGTIKGDGFPEEKTLNLPGIRNRTAEIDIRYTLIRKIKIFIALEIGTLINIDIRSFKNGCSQLNSGSVIFANNEISTIDDLDIDLTSIAPVKTIPELITFHVKAGSKVLKCVLHFHPQTLVQLENNEKYGSECLNVLGDCDVNSNQGKVIVDLWYSKNGTNTELPPPLLQSSKTKTLPEDLVVDINSEEAKILEITGGKGNSLALLASLKSKDFIVPDGFIITVNSYQRFLEANKTLKDTILELQDICWGNKEGNLQEMCIKTVEQIKSTKMSQIIKDAILDHVENIKNNLTSTERVSWAVRSSAIGEDSEELSAAGQNETFLGCAANEDVIKSVVACWASLFTYQSVQYRWQHGLAVDTDIAVVVQVMVPAETAGVLFTCHPTTSHPLQLVITANYGLGESVVSGKSDPDTFIIKRDYNTNNLSIVECSIGAKNSVITLSESGVKESSGEDLSGKSCISEKQALNLARVGVYLENVFGNARDIEWAFHNDQLYLLQSRPVTTKNIWTEFELIHEMDSAILSEDCVYTVANTGEVIREPATPLTQSVTLSAIEIGTQRAVSRKIEDPVVCKMVPVIHRRAMINCIQVMYKNVSKEIDISLKISDLAIFGHTVINDKIHQLALKIHGVSKSTELIGILIQGIYQAIFINKLVKKIQETAKKIQVNIDDKDSLNDIIEKIENNFKTLVDVTLMHNKSSFVSVFLQNISMNLLCEKSKDLTMDHCSDFGKIVSSCADVVSAEIPAALEEMAVMLQKQGLSKEFTQIKPENGVEWLRQHSAEVFEKIDDFLKKHGHRVLGEFELSSITWGMDPSKVITMLQAVADKEIITKAKAAEKIDVVSQLTTPKSKITKVILRFLLSKMQRAVASREATKSELIRSAHVFRLAYRQLAAKMVSKGILPSQDLIFFFTHHEIKQLIAKPNPMLISKAVRRQKLQPKLAELTFPEIMYGIPEPEKEEEFVNHLSGDVVISGTPVSDGVIKARACVIKGLSEIHQLKSGDILITYSTDIGWSPYFPMVAGVVTELGGLISHGAVVAREYGLPCLVGVKGALKTFKTGDIVFLSGKTGTLSLVND